MKLDYFESFVKDATSYSYINEDDYRKACDIVNVMLAIFDGDISTEGSQSDKKTRKISIVAKVYDLKKWIDSKNILLELVEWVSSDSFNIEFSERHDQTNSVLLDLSNSDKQCITLFSGGLDSLAGAYFNFSNDILSDYVGYTNKFEEGTHQTQLQKFYNGKFSSKGSEVDIKNKYKKNKKFHFQSTRSLLYLSLAISKALSSSVKEVRMYENGILSLNPEFARYTTKTTHPKTIALFNELLYSLGYDIKIFNKFEYKTKGEILEAMDSDFKLQIKNTFTCGKSRSGIDYNHKGQCGVCIPCILRKISLASYDNEVYDTTNYHVAYNNLSQVGNPYNIDYKVNMAYFEAYVSAIKKGEIFSELLCNSRKYHDCDDYLQKQMAMFNKFVKEYERYIEKYGVC